ncbi:hypothetical protein ATO11_08465 [Pseudaestuariivita atlantica]|uniref:aldehyde dehydrogenase (NAD(+)) n=1 Tax=Pseudaestuariivita atlantica TaxID=1317121 RepID=A0A0L1JRQ5_9RHOB|nr:hypothetical protein ATO11_08465 [Pseudaestuariivita atlantica]
MAGAVARARAVFDTTDPDLPRAPRLERIARLIAAIEARKEAFARAISAEMGSPIDFARDKQVVAAIAHLQATHAALAQAPDREVAAPGHWIRHEPLGVAALITPWNWPLNQAALKLGGALAAGCAAVIKPSELAPFSACLLAEALHEALPDGAAQVLMGDGATGEALVAAKGVDVISFTGSTSVGQHIAAEAGARLRPVLLELGGKSPNILFADCDLPLAVTQGVAHCFRNSGQSCNAASRMLVERSVYEDAVALAAAEAEAAVFADPSQPGDHFGPLVSEVQFNHVQRCIDRALAEGARCVAGGPGRAPGNTGGWFPRATVFADVTPDMDLFQTEVFGPVLSITPFDTEEEAVSLANAGPYGLAGYVQTADPDRAARVSRALRVGMVQAGGQSRVAGAPFGGRGASGYGREAGLWGIRAFQAVKSVSGAD